MNRRQLLQWACTAAALAPLGPLGLRVGAEVGDTWAREFAAALQEKPWLLGYLGCEDRPYEAIAKVEGQWPVALRGRLYRNGPGLHEFAGWRYRHLFDADGLLQCWQIADGRVGHRARLVTTHKLRREREAGRRLLPAFGSVPPAVQGVTSADAINAGNISVLPWGEQVLALWEAGSPWRLDADTLATEGIEHFSRDSAGLPFSAHPRQDADGQLWNFGYLAGADKLVLWHFDAQRQLQRCVVRDVPRVGIPHDFLVTARHLLLLLPPLVFEAPQNGSFVDGLRWQPEQATRVLVYSKSDLEQVAEFELPAQWVFHHGNAWEDEAGVIRFESARAQDPSLMLEGFRELMRGHDPELGSGDARLYGYRLDLRRGTASEQRLDERWVEFPAWLPEQTGKRHEALLLLGREAGSGTVHGGLDQLCLRWPENGNWSGWTYPEHLLPEEHLPVVDREGERWILGTALNWRAGQSQLNLFRFDAVEAGPVATAILPYAMPLGLHGRFLAA